MLVDLSWSHILILLIVALVVIGPKDLPRFMRTAGRWAGKVRSMADQFRRSFDEMARQSELDELRAELNALREVRPLAPLAEALHEPILPADMMAPLPPPEAETPTPPTDVPGP
ncbi:MAG: twin-arginine translocase subunit TatB [Alphaproteobacteria bacterium]|nr:twin-arginine translocase subunit TatB [Alphaproteobacteria bacterium]